MGKTNSPTYRRRKASAVAAAAVGLMAAAGTPALAATAGASAGTGAGTTSTASAGRAAASTNASGSTPIAPQLPLGISRLAAGTGQDVAITIDDGPDPRWTPKVLQVLRQNHVKATFCMIGTNAQKYPDLVREVAAEGHRLCDHSVDHDETMDHKPVAYQQQQILDAKSMIETAAPGVTVDYYRAPGGAFTPDSRATASSHGMQPLGWSVDPRDWSRPGLPAIITAVENQLPRQPTVLFHDGGGDRSQTVAALEQYLPWLTAQGYSFTFPARTAPAA